MSTPAAGPSSQTTLDPYRTLATVIQKPLAPFIPPGAAPTLSELLSLDGQSYKDRLEGKTIILDETGIPKSGPSSVIGRKRHRGDPAAQKAARAAHEARDTHRSERGLAGLRKARKRGGTIHRGSNLDYESLLPLYHLHTAYLTTLLALPPISQSAHQPPNMSQDWICSKLLKADFTGIQLTVETARNPSLNGLKGIVIEETSSTFRIVPADSRVRVIPKEGSQFKLSFPAYAPVETDQVDWEEHLRTSPRIEVSLLGTNFGYRSGDRAGRKFKLAQGEGGMGWGEPWVRGEWADVFPPAVERKKKKGGRPRSDHVGAEEGALSTVLHTEEKGVGAGGMRKKGKSRRKDPLAGGAHEVVY